MKQRPEIVERAYREGVTNIGQLSRKEVSQLNNAVKSGYLMKTLDYWWPIPKTRYTMNWDGMVENFRNSPDYVKD